MIRFFINCASISCILVLISNGMAQAQEGSDNRIDSNIRQSVINNLKVVLTENYIFPEMTGKMNAHIQKEQKEGAYSDLTDPREFSRALSQAMQDITHDKHLTVRYDPERAVTYDVNPEEDPEEAIRLREQNREQMRKNNFGFIKLEILSGNVGYLDLRAFNPPAFASKTAIAAMNFLANSDAVIIDLRRNAGGSPEMIQLISTYFFDEYDEVHLNDLYSRSDDFQKQHWTLPYVPGKRMPDTPLYILTSSYTFSAAEEFSYNLSGLERATIVGATTGGGAHPTTSVNLGDGFYARVSNARAINPISGKNWEGTGVQPHQEVPDPQALSVAHMDALKKLKETASDEQKATLDWALLTLETEMNPITLTSQELEKFAGTYGPSTITFENGALYYKRSGPSSKLIPMTPTLFAVDGLDYIRVEFKLDESGAVTALVSHYIDGTQDSNLRSY